MSHDNLGFKSSTTSMDCKKSPLPWPNNEKYSLKDSCNSPHVVELEDVKNYSKELDDEYDPFKHREVEHPTTYFETLFHLLKGSLGTGILAMPKAFHNSGYAIGLAGTVIIGLLCTYCIRILITAEYELCKRKKVPSMSYPATFEAALEEGPQNLRRFSRLSVHMTNVFLLIYQLGSCCVYVVFISTNLQSALASYVPYTRLEYYMLGILLPLIFINWIRNLKYLAPLSTFANGITFISFGIILYYLFDGNASLAKCQPIGNVENFPLYFGTVLFALEAIGVIMPLENEMKKPKNFGSPIGVLNVGMTIIITLYVGMGFFGYLRFNDEIQGSITLNLPNEIPAKIVQICLAVAIFMTHAVQCYVAIDICWNEYFSTFVQSESMKIVWEYVTRTCLVLVTFILAIVVPELELFISLFGAFCLSALGLAFPAIIQTCTYWHTVSDREKMFMTAKNGSLVIFGFLGLIVGTYTSMKSIYGHFSV